MLNASCKPKLYSFGQQSDNGKIMVPASYHLALNEWRLQRQNCKNMSTQKCKVGRWLSLKNNNVRYQQTSNDQIHHNMHVTSCSKIKTIFHSTLMYVQSPAVANQHPRTAGEQASTAPAKGHGVLSAQALPLEYHEYYQYIWRWYFILRTGGAG